MYVVKPRERVSDFYVPCGPVLAARDAMGRGNVGRARQHLERGLSGRRVQHSKIKANVGNVYAPGEIPRLLAVIESEIAEIEAELNKI